MKEIYTIGHSVYEADDFVQLLKNNNINTIVDVRSTPYSGICYIFMGDMLGARYEDKSLLFENGSVNFKKVQETKIFQDGITRLDKGILKGYNISLMCSEKEAFDCHRFGLISEYISTHLTGIEIKHIYPDKILSQKDLESQLIKKYHKKIDYLGLETDKMPLEQAYVLRNQDIAYNSITKEGDA